MEAVKYLVTYKRGGTARVRDGKGFSAPMREVNEFTPVIFDNLISNCDFNGNQDFEIVAVRGQDEIDLWTDRIVKQTAAALAATVERKKRTMAKIALQEAGGQAAVDAKKEQELLASLEDTGEATLGALIEAEGGTQAELPEDDGEPVNTDGKMIPRKRSHKKKVK